MAQVQFRNKTSDELAIFVGHNGWRVVKPNETIEVPDDDVVTPPTRARGGEIKSIDPEEEGGAVHYYQPDEVIVPAVSSADAYRTASDQWAEVTPTAKPAAAANAATAATSTPAPPASQEA